MLNCLPLYCVPSDETTEQIFSDGDNEGAPVAPVTHVEMPSSMDGNDCSEISVATDAIDATDGAVPRCNGSASDRQKWEEFDEDSVGALSNQPLLFLQTEVADTLSNSLDLPQAFNAFEDNFSPAFPNHDQPNDVFLTVDPFATELPDPLEAQFTFSGICNSVEGKKWDMSDSDDDGTPEEVDFQVKYVENVSSMTRGSAAVTFTRSHGAHAASSRSSSSSECLYSTPLPPPPTVVFPRYSERGGWLSKLSHRKGQLGKAFSIFRGIKSFCCCGNLVMYLAYVLSKQHC